MKKNVWIINHYATETFFDEGGRHYWFAKFLKKNGYDPVIFCCNAKHNSNKELFFDEEGLWNIHQSDTINVPYVVVKGRPYFGNGRARIFNMIDFYRNMKKVGRQYGSLYGSPDIIYASSVHPLALIDGIYLAKIFHVKCISEIRDLWPASIVAYGIATEKNIFVRFLKMLEKWTYKKSDGLIFTGEGAYDYIIDQKWQQIVPRDKVICINNGVDLEAFNYNKNHFHIDDVDLQNKDFFKVVYTGSIRKVNNLNMLLDVAKEVRDPRVKFLVWGDGDERDTLIKRCEEERLTNVCFKGRVEKKYIPYILSCANLNYAHNTPTSLFKYGLSFNKLFEYLAAGQPILFDFSAKYNPAIEAGAGMSVDGAHPIDVAKQIESFAEMDESVINRFRIAALSAAKKYDFCNLTEQLQGFIEKI